MLAQSGGSEMQLAQAHNAKARAEERWQADPEVWIGRMKIEHAKVALSEKGVGVRIIFFLFQQKIERKREWKIEKESLRDITVQF